MWAEWTRREAAREKLRRAGAKKSIMDHALLRLGVPLDLWRYCNLSCRRRDRHKALRRVRVAAARSMGCASAADLPPVKVYYGSAKFPATRRHETAVPVRGFADRCAAMHSVEPTDEYCTSQYDFRTGQRLAKVGLVDAGANKTFWVRGLLWCESTSNSTSSRSASAPASAVHVGGKRPRRNTHAKPNSEPEFKSHPKSKTVSSGGNPRGYFMSRDVIAAANILLVGTQAREAPTAKAHAAHGLQPTVTVKVNKGKRTRTQAAASATAAAARRRE
jgi:hypothetical protein